MTPESVAVPRVAGVPAREAGWLRILDLVLDSVVGFAVLGELVVILADVVGRAVFDAPVLWANDIATLALTLIGFIGGAVAYRRDQHICVRTVVDKFSPGRRDVCNAFVEWLVLGLAAICGINSWTVVRSRWDMLTPVLEWRGTWLTLPLTSGMALLGLYAVLRLVRLPGRAIVAGLVIVAGLAASGMVLHGFHEAGMSPGAASATSVRPT